MNGREVELAALSSWLRVAGGGLRVITGEAGSGKSALLRHLVVLANHELVNALVSAGLLRPPTGSMRPQAGTFDATMHLTGEHGASGSTAARCAMLERGSQA